MAAIHTHYDNLKVARNAPLEVIRAAYKTLSQKYHPDRNGHKDAPKIMAIINASYDVLSDPARRRAHDMWIAQQEAIAARQSRASQTEAATPPPPQSKPVTKERALIWPLLGHVARYWVLYGIAIVVGWSLLSDPSPPPPGPKPYNATPSAQVEPEIPVYVKPQVAPNGQYWPENAGYIPGYEQLNSDGLSSVTIDNSQNDSDVFVKLVSLDGVEAYPARQMFIPAFGKFTAENVKAGNYDVRYKDLDTGGLSRSESFVLEETLTYEGTRYSTISMTLYKVQHGNMQTYPLAESEF